MKKDTLSKFPAEVQLRSMIWALWDIKEALTGCEHFTRLVSVPLELRNCIYSGIVVSYSRPFMQTNGISRLPDRFSKFDTERQQLLHDSLLEARNLVYAHNDRLTEPSTLVRGGMSAQALNRVIVTVANDGKIKCGVMKSGYDETHVGEMAALCVLQIERIHEASTKMLGHFTKEKTYPPGEYTLGADFP